MVNVLRENIYLKDDEKISVIVVKENENTYCVKRFRQEGECAALDILTKIDFQSGPIKENGVNGCQNEDLIGIIIDRLQGFQTGEFPCRENSIAITKLQEALMWLEKRTADRKARGVEGLNIK